MSNFYNSKYKSFRITLKDLRIFVYLDPTYKTERKDLKNSILQSAKSLHFHLEHEIFFLTGGDLNVFHDNSFHVYNDGIVVIPSLTPHFSLSEHDNYRILIKFENEKSVLFKQILEYFKPNKISQFQINDEVVLYLKQLDKALSKHNTSEEEFVSLLTLIFTKLLDILGIENDDVNTETSQYLPIIDHTINTEFDKNINMAYLANKLFLSTRQVARIIKKNYNCSLSQLIVQKKLSISCLLLSKTDLPISKIISFINFETPNYFYTLFKKTYGLTPLQYRKNNKFLNINNN